MAVHLLALTDIQIKQLLHGGELKEIKIGEHL